jgi:hypothetical protein
VIAPLIGWFIGRAVGRQLGLARGRAAADKLAWQIARTLAVQVPHGHEFVGHPDGMVEEVIA